MLVKANLKDKKKSLYICDACSIKIHEPVKIQIKRRTDLVYTIHLCEKCFKKSLKVCENKI